MQRLLAVVLLLSALGCGSTSHIAPPNSGSGSTSPSAVSVWSGTYTGQLNFNGCVAGTLSCGGDSITLSISQYPSSVIPGEFDPKITITGTDDTEHTSFTGSGTSVYTGAAPSGPGNATSWASAMLSTGYSLSMLGYASSTTSAPVLTTKITVYKAISVNGTLVSSGIAYGILNRK